MSLSCRKSKWNQTDSHPLCEHQSHAYYWFHLQVLCHFDFIHGCVALLGLSHGCGASMVILDGDPRSLFGGSSAPLFPILLLLLLPVIHDKGVPSSNETRQDGQKDHQAEQHASSSRIGRGRRRGGGLQILVGRRARARRLLRMIRDFAVRARVTRGTVAARVVQTALIFFFHIILAATPVVAKGTAPRSLFGIAAALRDGIVVAKDGRHVLAKLLRTGQAQVGFPRVAFAVKEFRLKVVDRALAGQSIEASVVFGVAHGVRNLAQGARETGRALAVGALFEQ